jgi:hypothetical protein
MKTLLVLLLLPSLAVAASSAAAPAAQTDKDVDNIVFTDSSPLDAAARVATGADTTKSATQADDGGKPVHKPEPASKEANPVKSKEEAVTLPTLPASVMDGVTQIGGMDFVFEATPIDQAVKLISRQLDRAVHLSVGRNYRVSGVWKQAKGVDVLKDVAHNFGLVLRETPQAYILEEPSRAIAAPLADVKPEPVRPAAETLPASLFADSIVENVAPVTPKNLKKVQDKIDAQQKAAMERRAALEAALH